MGTNFDLENGVCGTVHTHFDPRNYCGRRSGGEGAGGSEAGLNIHPGNPTQKIAIPSVGTKWNQVGTKLKLKEALYGIAISKNSTKSEPSGTKSEPS